MQLPVVPAAERHRELIADLETHCPGLGKPQVMGIARLPATDQARLRSDKLEMRFVTQPLRFCEGELALVDPGWDGAIERCRRQRRGAVALISILVFSFGKNSFIELLMPPAVIVRRARDWRRIIRVQSHARLGCKFESAGCKGTSL